MSLPRPRGSALPNQASSALSRGTSATAQFPDAAVPGGQMAIGMLRDQRPRGHRCRHPGDKSCARRFQQHGITLAVARLPETKRGFVLLPRRWIVRRSFA
ncbi:hypothetical protein J2S34_000041 [Nitrobacter winogradskyi]|uniref:Uncharacterized protein n=1 Tax=Nitrobacter winogradskyi TaxID=913 RepID=A0ACC6ADX2_NITWI|nr:hypothetical protein [Nitrobacter winogradskyi]